MSGPRLNACSAIIDNEVWVMGGVDGRYNELATVEVYSPIRQFRAYPACRPSAS